MNAVSTRTRLSICLSIPKLFLILALLLSTTLAIGDTPSIRTCARIDRARKTTNKTCTKLYEEVKDQDIDLYNENVRDCHNCQIIILRWQVDWVTTNFPKFYQAKWWML